MKDTDTMQEVGRVNQKFKPYPAMKDSGVPWLGEIPAHWKKLPGRACYNEKKVPNKGLIEETVLSLSYGQIVIKPAEKLHGLVPTSFETYQIVEPGDIIIRPTDLQNDWNSLRFGLSRDRGIITSAYICLRTKEIMTREYGHQMLHAYDLKKIFYGLGSGLRQNLDWRDLKYLPCLAPPLSEQYAIVRFLDYTDRCIRRFIRAKQRIIKLLEEQKRAIIHRAVTRGLEPTVPLKDSGVPWLGEVPAHWDIFPLKYLSHRIQNGATPSTSEKNYYEKGTVPWFGPSNINKNILVEAPERYLSKEAFTYGKARLINGPAILIIVIGATAGKMALLNGEGSSNQQITAFELRTDKVNPEFCIQQMRISTVWLRSTASTATIPIIDSNTLTRLPVVLPNLEVQQAVLNYFSEQTRPYDSAISRTEREITLLREYRTRLIADVVTGKLDVRAAAESLPEEADEPAEEVADDDIEENGDTVEGDLDTEYEEVEA